MVFVTAVYAKPWMLAMGYDPNHEARQGRAILAVNRRRAVNRRY
jgi:hypothetical protein